MTVPGFSFINLSPLDVTKPKALPFQGGSFDADAPPEVRIQNPSSHGAAPGAVFMFLKCFWPNLQIKMLKKMKLNT